MSKIEKMSVQGVRSFGPEDGDRGIVEFNTPLTLILGPNGTGKTTIIECLKYMTTGDLPPGSKGGAFVHDPKIAHATLVRGQIRLQFKDTRGQPYIITRSIEAKQGPKNITFNTLDCTIDTKVNGERKSLTSRCGDLNREMVNLLGVSHPILNSVIFCHQEDSSWPLGEGKQLKEKFDAIFASTRYVKALDSIRKFRKDQVAVISNFKTEIKYLKQNKDTAAQIQAELDEVKVKHSATTDKLDKVQAKIQPVLEKLEKISTKEGDIVKLHTTIENMKGEMKQLEKSQRELKDKIETEFTGTTEELEIQLSEFASKVKQREQKLEMMDGELKKAEDALNRIGAEKTEILLEQGRLEQEAQVNEENIEARDKRIQKVAEDYGLTGFSGSTLTEQHVERFSDQMEKKSRECHLKARKNKSSFEDKEQEVQEQIDEAKKKKVPTATLR